jgi:hypothetical protein
MLYLKGENRLDAFSIRSETKEGCVLFSLLFDTLLEVLDKAVRQTKKRKTRTPPE